MIQCKTIRDSQASSRRRGMEVRAEFIKRAPISASMKFMNPKSWIATRKSMICAGASARNHLRGLSVRATKQMSLEALPKGNHPMGLAGLLEQMP